jgi:hypothetical protein
MVMGWFGGFGVRKELDMARKMERRMREQVEGQRVVAEGIYKDAVRVTLGRINQLQITLSLSGIDQSKRGSRGARHATSGKVSYSIARNGCYT